MTEASTLQELAKKQVIYRVPGMEQVLVKRNLSYRDAEEGSLAMDIYYPPGTDGGDPPPLVILVAGYPFPAEFLGTWGPAISWARLLAASGFAAVLYENREPESDLRALLRHAGAHAFSLGIDKERIGLWASSGNVPTAVGLLAETEHSNIRCAALWYGFMPDQDGSTATADAARKHGFADSCAGLSVADLRADVPLFIVRAGMDVFPGINDTIDHFTAAALGRNLPLTLVNHTSGSHGFDLDDESVSSREVIRQVLAFFFRHLSVTAPEHHHRYR